MLALCETTKWKGDFPNHTYLVDGMKALAYIKCGTKKPIYFNTPIKFDRRGRTFIELCANPFKVVKEDTRIAVKGSKGNTYYIDKDEGTCTCPGYTFRGTCKHIKDVLG